MKNSTIIMALVLTFFVIASVSAKVWVVNANGTGDFTKLTTAIDSAASGDTIFVAAGGYVESPNETEKKLTILGVGFSSDSTTTWSITLQKTLGLGEGSLISGLELFSALGSFDPSGTVSFRHKNMTIEKCHIVGGVSYGVLIQNDSCMISQNVIERAVGYRGGIQISDTIGRALFGINIVNNIIHDCENGIIIVGGTRGDEVIANNIFLKNFYAIDHRSSSEFSGKVYSNIFMESYTTVLGAGIPSYYFANNCFWNNTQNNVPPFAIGSVFADPGFQNYSSSEGYQYGVSNLRLGVGSPCIDNGEPNSGNNDRDGSRNDIGVYGGPFEFDDTGAPSFPAVIHLSVNPYSAPVGGNITIKVLGRIGR